MRISAGHHETQLLPPCADRPLAQLQLTNANISALLAFHGAGFSLACPRKDDRLFYPLLVIFSRNEELRSLHAKNNVGSVSLLREGAMADG